MSDRRTDQHRRTGEPLLSVRNLKKHYPITEGILSKEVGRVRAVDGIDFDVYPGETVGIVGESGCGKSTAASSLIRLEEPTDGSVLFDGEDITEYDREEMKAFRRRVQMIFQDPESSFDPRMSIGDAIAEPLTVQGLTDTARRREIIADLLERVGLSASDADRYPHELSGGQKQRVGLARALSMNPDMIIADEPVSALDVSIQSEILALMNDLQEKFGLSILIISHNLAVIRQICDRVAVMYLGEIVELGRTDEVFANPQHPYTRALLASIPTADPTDRGMGVELTGDVPSPSNPPSGCRFHTRCPEVIQPEGYEFEQSVWRRVMDLRQKLDSGSIDVEAIRDMILTETDSYETTAEIPTAKTRVRVREEFDIPKPLSDPQAESVLEEAIEEIVTGNDEAAREYLAAEFATPCETQSPVLEDTESGQTASCLRIENELPPSEVEQTVRSD
ncbi:ABC-type transport system ATP-binding protein (probable substrate dipeptide/oligopeptide) [Natrialba magadii ATCC 43099]|nr:ABC-type transport system ATP-binding protein (probable substrate dipeptide/oligopeptide) [Natrialba magadii ATCC 43099]